MICDTLDLKLVTYNSSAGSKICSYDVDVDISVNGIKFDGFIDYWSLFCNTHLKPADYYNFYNFGPFSQYNRSIKRYNGIISSVFLETCSCGDAGCNGINNGLRVYKKKKYFKYVALKKDGYPDGILGTGKWNLTFSKENILEIRKHIVHFFIENEHILKFYDDDIDLAKKIYNDNYELI